MPKLLISVLLAVSLVGCGGKPELRSTEGLTVVEGVGGMPAPERSDLIAGDRVALIGPLDTITVRVFGVPELSGPMQVDTAGRIAMPLIGTVDARGKTPDELSRTIERAFAGRYVRDPNVTININSAVSQVVTVDGAVVEPGLYPVTNQMTLMRAVASARGLTELAKEDDVVILRNVEGRRLAGLYNLTSIRRGIYSDPEIYPNDIVIVGDSPTRRLFKNLFGIAPALAAPLVAILQ